MIKVEHITKRFKDTIALDDVSFEVEKGEIVGFLGPNAAGKTTMMRILTSFFTPDEGRAEVCKYDCVKEDYMVRKMIGYVPENNPLYLDMDVKSFLKFMASIKGAPKERIDEVALACNISDVLTKRIEKLSRGFRQRVALASALINDPPVLILDEPTSGLDPIAQKEIHSLIEKEGKEKTILLSTHILSEAEEICNRVIIINKGKIIYSGRPKGSPPSKIAYITLKGENIEERLKTISNIKIEAISKTEKGESFKIIPEDGRDIREELFFFTKKEGFVLLELSLEEKSLKDVFLEITT